MEGDSTPLRGSYGRACANCARAKYKCISRGDGVNCERCHRLGKDCLPPISVRKRNVEKPSSSKRNLVEEKVDDLVSLLRSRAVGKQPQSAGPDLPATSNILSSDLKHLLTPESTSTTPANVVIDATTGFARFAPPVPGVPPLNGMPTSPIASYVSLYDIPDATAEEQLDTFRRIFLPHFAFTHIPITTSASILRGQKPFLWLIIMSLTTKSAAQQMAMGDTIRRIVSQQVLAEQEKSLDLLLGIICYIVWSHYHKKDKSPLALWGQLAAALASELEIHRPPLGDLAQLSSKAALFPTRVPQVRTMEERRALLGTYLATSMVWIALRKMEPLRWTSYMDDCVRALTEDSESELDILLATQAKYHVIMNQMTPNPAEFISANESAKPQPPYIVKAMLLQVHSIQSSLPIELQSNRSILLFMYSAEITVKEALFNRPRAHDQTGLSNIQRLEGLESILTAIERWLEIIYEIPLPDWIGITFSIFTQFGHCLMLLFKLGTLDEPGWDTGEVMRRANLLDILEFFAQRLDDIPRILGMTDTTNVGESGIFFKSSRLLRGIRAVFASKMALNSQSGEISSLAEFDDGLSLPGDIAMELLEDPWIPDLFSSWWDL